MKILCWVLLGLMVGCASSRDWRPKVGDTYEEVCDKMGRLPNEIVEDGIYSVCTWREPYIDGPSFLVVWFGGLPAAKPPVAGAHGPTEEPRASKIRGPYMRNYEALAPRRDR